jgi:hypothetical protein
MSILNVTAQDSVANLEDRVSMNTLAAFVSNSFQSWEPSFSPLKYPVDIRFWVYRMYSALRRRASLLASAFNGMSTFDYPTGLGRKYL